MAVKEMIDEVLQTLPEERLLELLDFARFLSCAEEQADWRRFGRAQLARAYGPNEPEYTEADLIGRSVAPLIASHVRR